MRRVLFLVLMLCLGPAVAAPVAAPVLRGWGHRRSAAFGIPLESGWAQLLQQRLRQQGYPHRVVNGSVSGETTAGGLARLPAALKAHRPAIVLIELGGNDGLRGLPLKDLRANLRGMVSQSRAAGAQALVFEMTVPPNYGEAYTRGFTQAFGKVAREQQARLVPFFLASIALDPKWFMEDGIHPTVAAQPLLLDAVWPTLLPALKAPQRPDQRK
ncbi:MAG: arylesterase [Gammaproteobacteria bacterium]